MRSTIQHSICVSTCFSALLACGRPGPRQEPASTALVAASALQRTAPPVQQPDAGPCLTEDVVGDSKSDADLDADGTPDRIVERLGELAVYVRRGACFELRATLPFDGPLAFVHARAPHDGLSDLSVETWLMHGDRRVESFRWTGTGFVSTGHTQQIEGRRR